MYYEAGRRMLLLPEQLPPGLWPAASDPLDLLCAKLSTMAYHPGPELERLLLRGGLAMDHPPFRAERDVFTIGVGTFAFMACTEHVALVAFRGTELLDLDDIRKILDLHPKPWMPGGRVHSGFADALAPVWDAIETALAEHDLPVVFTGHSLGGALATLAASGGWPRPAHALVTFGSPRVGDAEFGETLRDLPVRRHVNCCDLVTRLPWAGDDYRHVGTLHYIDRARRIMIDPPDDDARRDRLAGRRWYARHVRRPSTFLTRGSADHIPANYVLALAAGG